MPVKVQTTTALTKENE